LISLRVSSDLKDKNRLFYGKPILSTSGNPPLHSLSLYKSIVQALSN
jgi:hypothetical protein